MKTPEFLCFCLFFGTVPGKRHENEQEVMTVVVPEGRDAILPCSLSTKLNLQHEVFDWKKDGQKEVFLYSARDEYNNGRPGQDEQFKGRVSHFPEELKLGNASIVIRNTKVVDSGDYTCIFPLLQPKQQSFIKLIVESVFKDRSGDVTATQQEISHVTEAEIYMPRCGKTAEPCCGAGMVVAAFCGGALSTAVLFVVIKYIRR